MEHNYGMFCGNGTVFVQDMQDCLTTMWREIVVKCFGRVLDYHNSFDNFLSGGSTDATCKVWCK